VLSLQLGLDAETLNKFGTGRLPGLIGAEITSVEPELLRAPVHRGRTTQVWDAEVTAEVTGRTIAAFRCTQMVLWPKRSSGG
jgi:hypothetical protein